MKIQRKQVNALIGAVGVLGLTGSPAAAGMDVYGYGPPGGGGASTGIWEWFIGGSGGYLFDAGEDMWTFHFGAKMNSGMGIHALFVEVGWVSTDDIGVVPAFPWPVAVGVDVDIVPLSFNYQYGGAFVSGSLWGYYIGGGLGMAHYDVSVGLLSDSSREFYAQLFAGISYEFSRNFNVFTGLRYVHADTSRAAFYAGDGLDDVLLELGLRLTF